MAWEYYCHVCKKLRLSLLIAAPVVCVTCGGSGIEVDQPGSERLKLLRYGEGDPDGAITAIVFPDSDRGEC